jgi:apolipoprotein N-acyltransferase
VALEILRGRLLTGFPWNFLGASQFKLLPLIQIASITGVYGVSFLIVWFSVSLGAALVFLSLGPTVRGGLVREIILPLLAAAGVAAFGFQKLNVTPTQGAELKVALIQPSIPQTLIWDERENDTRFEQTLAVSKKALEAKPDLIVWPESAMPPAKQEYFAAISQLITSHHVWMILCSDDVELEHLSSTKAKTNYFNSSFLFSPEGKYIAKYHKQRLVMFGEFVPLLDWLPFLQAFTPIEGGFTPGRGPVPFELEKPRAKTSVLICFEDTFPHGARQHVTADTDFLLNLTSDAWFGHGAAQWQQAATSLFRAIENGVPLIRCTNDGVTCWIDAQGRLQQIFKDASGSIYGPGYMIANIPLRSSNPTAPTYYNQHGDVFGWSCVALGLVISALGFARKSFSSH